MAPQEVAIYREERMDMDAQMRRQLEAAETKVIYHLTDVEHAEPLPCGPDCALNDVS
jgi:hypothetical protein